MTDTSVTSAEILAAIRRRKAPQPIVREVVLHDTHATPSRYGSAKVRRIDALMLGPRGKLTAIEIKVSRADFKRDTEEKRGAWRDHTDYFVYAAPVGLIEPSEVPEGCGLWEYYPDVLYWRDAIQSIVRPKANPNPIPLPQRVWNAMFYRVSNYERSAS